MGETDNSNEVFVEWWEKHAVQLVINGNHVFLYLAIVNSKDK